LLGNKLPAPAHGRRSVEGFWREACWEPRFSPIRYHAQIQSTRDGSAEAARFPCLRPPSRPVDPIGTNQASFCSIFLPSAINGLEQAATRIQVVRKQASTDQRFNSNLEHLDPLLGKCTVALASHGSRGFRRPLMRRGYTSFACVKKSSALCRAEAPEPSMLLKCAKAF